MKGFGHSVRVVTIAHLVIVLGLGALSGCRWLLREKPKQVIPIEFTVEVPGDVEPVMTPEPAPAAPTPAPTPAPPTPPTPPESKKVAEPKKVVEPKKEPPKPAPRPKIETSTRRVKRSEGTPSKPKLTPEEIERLLAQGARPSDRTQIPPDVDARGFACVRSAFYDVWVQPSRAEVGDATAEATIVLGAGGRVLSGQLSRPSGNAVLDNSVRRALNAVKQVAGLPDGFEKRHREISVAFRVE